MTPPCNNRCTFICRPHRHARGCQSRASHRTIEGELASLLGSPWTQAGRPARPCGSRRVNRFVRPACIGPHASAHPADFFAFEGERGAGLSDLVDDRDLPSLETRMNGVPAVIDAPPTAPPATPADFFAFEGKRGAGLSDLVDDRDLPSLETRMDGVRAVMDAAGSGRAAILGASEGAPMTILFAAPPIRSARAPRLRP